MGKKSLGIDISDGQIIGVALQQHGKSSTVTGCLSLPLSEDVDIAQQARLICEQLDWQEGVCVCGLPLSVLSVRNFFLPFRDPRKIAQALPFELEEQLLVPVDRLITDFFLSEASDSGSQVVAFATEKNFLSGLLDGLEGVADPDIITPAAASLAAQVVSHNGENENLLLLYADLHSITMVLIHGEQPLFYRRLSYSEQVILQPPFFLEGGQAEVADMVGLEQCIHHSCVSIAQSLDYFHLDRKEAVRPNRVALTGPLAEVEGMTGMIASVLHLPVEKLDLLAANKIVCPEDVCAPWPSHQFDQAVSLALLGFSKKAGINFRKEVFVKKRVFFSTRKQLVRAVAAAAILAVCLLGYMWNDYRLLWNRDKVLRNELTAIFKQTFPKVTKVHEPYIEMKAALKTVQGPEAPTELFASGKRVLGLLADISARIPETVALQVSRLAIEREIVLMKGTTDTFNSVETIKNSLSASPRYKGVQIVSATADKEKKNGSVRFEIQLQLGGGV
jgi:general secretion pathway protein L